MEGCPCTHPMGDHAAAVMARTPASPLSDTLTCQRCNHIADVHQKSEAALRSEALILAEQSERFLAQFPELDLSDVERFDHEGEALSMAANAYERMASAEKHVDPSSWSRATEKTSRRSANDLMERLWDVRDELCGRKRATR
jgi:hypothetical protein